MENKVGFLITFMGVSVICMVDSRGLGFDSRGAPSTKNTLKALLRYDSSDDCGGYQISPIFTYPTKRRTQELTNETTYFYHVIKLVILIDHVV